MLRHTRPVLSRKGHANIFILFQRSTLIQEFDKLEDFHEATPTCFKDANETDAFSPILDRYDSRLVITAPTTLGNQCKNVPFIIDTGAPITVIHKDTIGRFLKNFDVDQARDANIDILIGQEPISARVNIDTKGTFKHLNLIGLDFIQQAIPGFRGYINANISKFQPLGNVPVTNGTIATMVTPEKPLVMCLKDAIKAKLPNTCANIEAPSIIIKDPNNNIMHDKDPLLANIEYVFEVPSQRKKATSFFSFSFKR